LVTTPEILLECANTAARRTYRRDVVEFRDRLAKVGGIIVPTLDEVQNAWKAYADGIGANAGMVDQISFVVMRRLKLTQVFTNDRHFAACGFETLF
jgi:predicted nucleic acid-binding protein